MSTVYCIWVFINVSLAPSPLPSPISVPPPAEGTGLPSSCRSADGRGRSARPRHHDTATQSPAASAADEWLHDIRRLNGGDSLSVRCDCQPQRERGLRFCHLIESVLRVDHW